MKPRAYYLVALTPLYCRTYAPRPYGVVGELGALSERWVRRETGRGRYRFAVLAGPVRKKAEAEMLRALLLLAEPDRGYTRDEDRGFWGHGVGCVVRRWPGGKAPPERHARLRARWADPEDRARTPVDETPARREPLDLPMSAKRAWEEM